MKLNLFKLFQKNKEEKQIDEKDLTIDEYKNLITKIMKGFKYLFVAFSVAIVSDWALEYSWIKTILYLSIIFTLFLLIRITNKMDKKRKINENKTGVENNEN